MRTISMKKFRERQAGAGWSGAGRWCARGLGGVGWVARVLVCAACVVSAGISGGCERKKAYGQETPDKVIESAVSMIKNGDAKKLPDLVYADSAEMRATLDQVGRLMGRMQELAKAVESRFPQELAALKQDAESGKLEDLITTISAGPEGPGDGGMPGGTGTGPRPPREVVIGAGPGGASVQGGGSGGSQPDEKFKASLRTAVNQLFADPYGWLEANASRLSTEMVSDDTAMVLLDSKPIFGIASIPMQKVDEKWYVAIPFNMPPLSAGMPRTEAQWKILRSVIQVLEKTVKDMTRDVREGRVGSLDALGRSAQEKVMFPVVIAFVAYGREMDVSSRIDRRFKQFQERQKAWVKARVKAAGGDEEKSADAKKYVSSKLLAAMNAVAPAELEKQVRANKPSGFDKMSDAEFEEAAGAWLKNAGLSVRLDGELTPEKVDGVIGPWQASRIEASRKGKGGK